MNLHDARELARFIQDTQDCACTVPYGHGPDGYFARIWTSLPDNLDYRNQGAAHPQDFHSWKAAWDWFERSRLAKEEYHRQLYAPQRRSPIDILIDRAVGRE